MDVETLGSRRSEKDAREAVSPPPGEGSTPVGGKGKSGEAGKLAEQVAKTDTSEAVNPSRREGRKTGTSQPEEALAKNRQGPWSKTVRFLRIVFFSSLTRRIIYLNLAALVVLLSAILYLNQFREGLIDARVQSLLIQGRIIAGAIASSATVETDSIMIDPDKLLDMQAGDSISPSFDSLDTLESPIKPEKVAPLLRTLIQPTRTRARIYDRDGILVLDSRHLYGGGEVVRFDLPSLTQGQEKEGMIARIGKTLNRWLQRRDLPVYHEVTSFGTDYPEVKTAMTGQPQTMVRLTEQGEHVISVAVPVQRLRAVVGVLLLSTQGGDIDRIVTEERLAILRIFLVAGIVLMVLSGLLAGTIANPLRKLAEAAVRVRHGVNSRVQIPDFSQRQDEIGNLSQSLRDMTNALYARIEAIESFAADVSHELKNPLTSLRSAVETLPLAKNETTRNRLTEIIQHDVRRLDRLITDISDASRLDAELAREDSTQVDLKAMLENIVTMRRLVPNVGKAGGKEGGGKIGKSVAIGLDIAQARGADAYVISGHDSRLGQVINNLLDNARSFAPASNGQIDVTMRRIAGGQIEIAVEDNGPGIHAEKIERIFERFYTDRPEEEGFGQNSGLGLSISRQIIEAHGGMIRAENREPPQTGARFVVTLPAKRRGT
ncbi:MAG: sensor histidine kinase [Salaquimonas sp.]|jgi:two-component system sensor histidine kinase ChvG|nr:sensor histidine kinase [Salaquimonas sp.]